jgi:TatD DNase family protein
LTWTEKTIDELRALYFSENVTLPSRTDVLPARTVSKAKGLTHSEGDSSLLPVAQNDRHKKIVAIGEIGLDYYWDSAPHGHQQRVFREQLDLAKELEIPVVIHMREKGDAINGPCYEDALNILEEWVTGLDPDKEALRKYPGVLHSFSGSLETAQRGIALNFHIGITGPVTFKNAEYKQEMAAQLPLENLLIETDAPYLAPHPQRGKRNEPAFVAEIADKIAGLQSRNQEEVASVTTRNAMRLFAWGEDF